MAIGVTCPECSYSFSVRDEYAGKRGKCPQCGGVFRADAAAEEAPMIVANGSHGGAKRRNGASEGPAFGSVAVSAPVHTSGYSGTSSSSGYAKRQRSGGMPKWGWAAIGLMLLAAGGSIAGAFMLSPDPAEVKKIVKERTSKAAKAITKVENEVLEKLDETEEKIDLEDKIEEFARPKTIDTDVIPGVVKVLNVQGGGPRGSGTGWIFNDQHWIATNHHVVAGCESLYVMTADGKKHDIEGVIADK
jgi:hypothetical protein